MSFWYYWLAAGIILIIIEIFTPGFVLASFGIGCLLAAIAAGLGLSVYFQIIAFCVGTIVVFFGIRPLYKKHLLPEADREPTNIEALRGQKARVIETIDPDKDSGRVKIGGEDWRAVCPDHLILPVGELVEVVRIEGVKAIVKKIKSKNTKQNGPSNAISEQEG
ncbi:MAG: NfeD family protein [Calditrichales bacterium]|nr:MAG: NfeD family protein [Calditrichales bacterium]